MKDFIILFLNLFDKNQGVVVAATYQKHGPNQALGGGRMHF